MGRRNGAGSQIAYSTPANMGIVVPMSPEARGVTSYLAISDDYEIADVAIRLDNVTGPFNGSIGYKAAVGFGSQMKSAANLTNSFAGPVTNMTFTDSASGTYNGTSDGSNNSYRTTAKSGANFSELYGTSSMGQWGIVMGETETARSAAQIARGYTNINQWSVLVTPMTFTMTPYVIEDEDTLDEILGFNDANAISSHSINVAEMETSEVNSLINSIYESELFNLYDPTDPTSGDRQNIWVVENGLGVGMGSASVVGIDDGSKTGLWDKLYNMLPKNRQNEDAGVLSSTTEFEIEVDADGAILPVTMRFPYRGDEFDLRKIFVFYEFIDTNPMGEVVTPSEPVMLFGDSDNAVIPMSDAIDNGIVSADGEFLVINYFVLDGEGMPALVDGNFIVPDGVRNANLIDPLWVVETEKHSSSSDCNGLALGFAALVVLPMLRKRFW